MNSQNHPVYIRDFDATTSVGKDWSSSREALLDGSSGLTPESIHGDCTLTGRVDLPGEGTGQSNRNVPRYHQLAEHCLENLLSRLNHLPDRRLGVVAASSKGGLGQYSPNAVTQLENPGIWAGMLAQTFPQDSMTASPNTACATGLTAVIDAARWIKHGQVDHAVVIAAESSFVPLLMAGYQTMGVLCDREGMRPFHPDRSGFALAEAGACLYLHNARLDDFFGSEPKGKIESWTESADAHHMTDMDESASTLKRTLNTTTERAGWTPEQLDLVHAHLTTTPMNDRIESRALELWSDIIVQGIKPALGHTLGTAGLIEFIATVDVLDQQQPFPINNIHHSSIPRHSLPDEADQSTFERALTWNMGFGGQNACVAVRKP